MFDLEIKIKNTINNSDTISQIILSHFLLCDVFFWDKLQTINNKCMDVARASVTSLYKSIQKEQLHWHFWSYHTCIIDTMLLQYIILILILILQLLQNCTKKSSLRDFQHSQ